MRIGPCTEQFPISVSEYEQVRADRTLFVLVNGHEAPDVEDVVEDEGVFVVVRKRSGEPERLAGATDPRLIPPRIVSDVLHFP